jgi:ABC-type thiamin/hydroxymethylpyrimidine transport system permease subunit
MKKRTFYFSTRDLITMGALAALGGVSSTYVNMIGNIFQASMGVAGTTQWAAGLHILWLVLSFGIIGKPGSGLITGILKGAVELLSGNTHGIIILLVDIVAGLLVEFVFLFFRNKRNLGAFLLAGGISSASNVYVFQTFAFLPRDVLI